MSKIEINYSKICPYLVANPTNLKTMSVDLSTGLETNDYCEVGENMLDSDVQTDLMTRPEKVSAMYRVWVVNFFLTDLIKQLK